MPPACERGGGSTMVCESVCCDVSTCILPRTGDVLPKQYMNIITELDLQCNLHSCIIVNMAKKNWIQKAIKKPGSLRKALGAKKGKKIPKSKLKAAVKKGGTLGKRANLAMTLGKLRRK